MKRSERGAKNNPFLNLFLSTSLLFLAPFYVVLFGHSEANRGISWIGQGCHAKADCGAVMAAYEGVQTVNAGWLYGTFNATGCKCSKVLLADPRPKRIRFDICNSTCFPERGRRCQRHECFARMTGRQASRAILNKDPATFARIDSTIALAKADMAQAVAPVEWFVKPCLECSISREARAALTQYVASHFPGIPLVDNPLRGPCFPGMICERHGDVRGDANTIVDLDGKSYLEVNKKSFWKQNNDALMVLAWKPCANGWRPGPFVAPERRSKFCTKKSAKMFNDGMKGKHR